ncbi:RNA 2'-phosphotransferase [Oscillatoriales cyanobacterium LEGE 11467]|uniref:Probable RNA 2'-phosphotransferase n=1 Tax=Zarconia navalis LEGE 11467 TaxID=1828826 RepID=A0A928W211_9CYAN|nr:RNA 2'-phosphotransferase [Zarconia navalis]MBE9042541.1 RNA 2'-phosphotransferase [Zarconia navalis LEGE 11467]
MNPDRRVKISKYLSYHLRHHPDRIGLTLRSGGWVEVETLLIAAKKHQFPIRDWELREVVATNDKQRFSFNEMGTCIRANQGHSIKVDLQLESTVPPDCLYHGTHPKALESILHEGLRKMARHHVHLSAEIETARQVGRRRGKPIVLEIDAIAMHRQGHQFFRSQNGVWLVDRVPPEFLRESVEKSENR